MLRRFARWLLRDDLRRVRAWLDENGEHRSRLDGSNCGGSPCYCGLDNVYRWLGDESYQPSRVG